MGKPVKTLHALNWYYGNICSCRFGIFSKRLVRTSALPTARWRAISKMPFKLRKNTMPRRFAPRLFLTISQKVKIGGERGIRTREPLRVTRFPSVRTRPTMRSLRDGQHYNRKRRREQPKRLMKCLNVCSSFQRLLAILKPL